MDIKLPFNLRLLVIITAAVVLVFSVGSGGQSVDVFPKYAIDGDGDYVFFDDNGNEDLCRLRLLGKVSCKMATIFKLADGKIKCVLSNDDKMRYWDLKRDGSAVSIFKQRMPGCASPFQMVNGVGCINILTDKSSMAAARNICHNNESDLFIADSVGHLQRLWTYLNTLNGFIMTILGISYTPYIWVGVNGSEWLEGRPVSEWISTYDPLNTNSTCGRLVATGNVIQSACVYSSPNLFTAWVICHRRVNA